MSDMLIGPDISPEVWGYDRDKGFVVAGTWEVVAIVSEHEQSGRQDANGTLLGAAQLMADVLADVLWANTPTPTLPPRVLAAVRDALKEAGYKEVPNG